MAGTRRPVRSTATPACPPVTHGRSNASPGGGCRLSLVLALDTATALGSVAVGRGAALLAQVVMGDRRHAAAATPAVQESLRLAGVDSADLEEVILADGPGSFTGLRIGFATVKGLYQEHPHLVVHTIPSLLAAAWSARPFTGEPVAAVYDALRGDIFAAVYRFGDARVEVLVPPGLMSPADLVRAAPRPGVAVGDGAVLHAAMMHQWTGRPPVGPPVGAPTAHALLELLVTAGAATRVTDVAALEPTYGRLAEAQVRWERAHGTSLPHSRRTTD